MRMFAETEVVSLLWNLLILPSVFAHSSYALGKGRVI